MAGGTWDYAKQGAAGGLHPFQSAPDANLSIGSRGVAAICEPLSWGPIGQVMAVNAGADTTPFTGYAPTEEGSRFLAEIFKGTNRTAAPSQVLLYRPAANGSAAGHRHRWGTDHHCQIPGHPGKRHLGHHRRGPG